MINTPILTQREREVISKKLEGKKLSQQDSNYLSRFVRPKLKEITKLDAQSLLTKLHYNQKAKSIENKIKKIILKSIKETESIIAYGSAIQTNYREYNDIDILIVTKKEIYKKPKDKYKKILELKNLLSKEEITADPQIYDKETLIKNYPHSPSLIYQLKDSKIIYGTLALPKRIEIYNIDLQMKLDWSKIHDPSPEGKEIYQALRNAILVKLILNKIIDNQKLREALNDEIGRNLLEKLKSNKESKIERKLALNYLKELVKQSRNEIRGGLWEKIEL